MTYTTIVTPTPVHIELPLYDQQINIQFVVCFYFFRLLKIYSFNKRSIQVAF